MSSENPQKIFIGVAWPYVNGDIHFGHLAGYLVPADIFARFNRFIGNEVLMVSGADCFGTPVTVEADKRGVSPAEIVDEYNPKHIELFKELELSFDLYTKTNNPTHIRVVQDMFLGLLEKGYIYKDSSEQYFSESEDRFLPDRYVEGTCPHCGDTDARSDQCDNCGRVLSQGELIDPRSKLSKSAVSMKTTEHYFFDWPKLEGFLKSYVTSHEKDWRPWVYKETVGWLETGLKPRSITRDLDWGVEIPNDRIPEAQRIDGYEHKRIYVWFEAVIGYLSASIKFSEDSDNPELWKSFWHSADAKHYYFMGKDNLVFHTLFWPGQLHAYDEGLHLPDVPAVNHFLSLNGQAFSKSFGVTLDPRKILADFDLDLVRLYLCLIMPENQDSDFNWNDFITKTNNLVIANLGNFVFRTMKLAENLDTSSVKADAEISTAIEAALNEAKTLLAGCNFKRYAERILELSALANKYLSDTTPWTVKKTDMDRYAVIMRGALEIAIALGVLLKPIAPKTAEKLFGMLNLNIERWPTAVEVAEMANAASVSAPSPLFAKIEATEEDIASFNEKYR